MTNTITTNVTHVISINFDVNKKVRYKMNCYIRTISLTVIGLMLLVSTSIEIEITIIQDFVAKKQYELPY